MAVVAAALLGDDDMGGFSVAPPDSGLRRNDGLGFGMTGDMTGHAGGDQRRQQPGWPRLPQQLRPVRSLRQLLAMISAATRCQGSPVLRWLAMKAAGLGRGGRRC